MNNSKIKIVYWTILIIVSLLLLLDAVGGITRQQDGVNVLRHLGYPEYLLPVAGTAKLFAIVAILQTKYVAIKEWAYAGIVINLILAFASRAIVGDSVIEIISPLIFLGVVFIPYFLWRRIYLNKKPKTKSSNVIPGLS